MYIDTTTNEWGLTQAAIMQRHPLTVFPDPFVPLEQYAQVVDQPQPAFDATTHKTVELPPVEGEGGFLQQWAVVPLSSEELAQLEADRLAAEKAARDAARITISRTQGLVYIYRNLRVTEADVETLIAGMDDEDAKYEAGLYFRASTWDSDNPHVLMFGAGIGLDTPAKLEEAFRAAQAL
ncbi:hypothetical protein [uncultured Comamonas sp.]|uniref:hypothetical protein n=1 Tax=uncultured Comamonas sp. TaxID=114710 RepID=UPI0037479BBC